LKPKNGVCSKKIFLLNTVKHQNGVKNAVFEKKKKIAGSLLLAIIIKNVSFFWEWAKFHLGPY